MSLELIWTCDALPCSKFLIRDIGTDNYQGWTFTWLGPATEPGKHYCPYHSRIHRLKKGLRKGKMWLYSPFILFLRKVVLRAIRSFQVEKYKVNL